MYRNQIISFAAICALFCGVPALAQDGSEKSAATEQKSTLSEKAWEDSGLVSSSRLQAALVTADDNRPELSKALKECRSSKLELLCVRFLIENMPDSDLKSLSADFLIDNVRLALKARQDTAWARKVPLDIFLNDVLPYASVNEKREDWRSEFHSQFRDLVQHCQTTGEAAQELNKNVFRILKVRYSTKRKKPDQSPSESMETGLASCTGLSVILTDACRSVGVPARLAGTPLWVNKRGNHTWVEVWDEGNWKFTGACEYDANGLNRGWFAGIAAQADAAKPEHRIYATSFRRTDIHFPMVWKWKSKAVPAVDVTARYTGKKSTTPKPLDDDKFLVAIRLVDSSRQRVALPVKVVSKGKVLFTGKTRNESNDANDLLEFDLEPGEYELHISTKSGMQVEKFSVAAKKNQLLKFEIR